MIVSIDIGTSYSSICRLDPNGKAQPVDIGTGASMFGSKNSLPTAVFVEEDGRLLIGQAAMNRRKSNPQNFRMEFKRNLGEDIPIVLGGRNFRPEDLYTELFRHMKECAERESGEPVELSYLTYPASYGEGRKDRIRAAAKAAGLFEVELVDEPTAAAMCYCAEGYIEDGQTLLVYDFGGGTFDVSVLRYEGGAFRLLSEPGGLERCGGIDMDRLIFQDMMSRVDADILESLKARQRNYMHFVNQLGELAVKAKHHLSAAQVFDEEIEIGFDMVPYRLTVERFNEMIAPLVGGTIQACRQTLEEVGVDASELSAILMMGGTSRVPLVQNMAQGISRTARLLYSVNLELAVAQGALNYRNNRNKQHGKKDKNNSDNKKNERDNRSDSNARSAQDWLDRGLEAEEREEWTEAVSCYQKAAELGNAEAMCHLGNCYLGGHGVEEDDEQAVRWYRQAVKRGNVDAMCCLGNSYDYGWGVEKDKEQAVQWYRKAAE